jgi:transcriptional regulator of acetoin/glycerol metabolism
VITDDWVLNCWLNFRFWRLDGYQEKLEDMRPEPITMAEWEKAAIEQAFRATGGNLAAAARRLQIGRTTLYRKLAKYKLFEVAEPATGEP